MLPLDRNQAIMTQEPTREDTKQFLERMWNIEERVDEALRNAKDAAALRYDRDRGREATTYEPGDKSVALYTRDHDAMGQRKTIR